MKKVISIILAVTIVYSIIFSNSFLMNVNAATSGTTGDCTWTLSDGVLTISGEGSMGHYLYRAPWSGTGFTKVIIKNGVRSIGNSAFAGCSGLTSIEIPEGVTSIGSYAFKGCSGLTSIEIPDSVISIGVDVLSGCSNLQYNIYENGYYLGNTGKPYRWLVGFASNNFATYDIADTTVIIGNSAFENFSTLKSIILPNGVTDIGNSAFSGCTGITSIEIPEGVTSIGNYAFEGCSGLTSIEISEGVTSIGNYAFEGCSGLTSIEIPDSVKYMGLGVFQGCVSVTSMKLPFVGRDANSTSSTTIGWLYGTESSEQHSDYVPSSLQKIELSEQCTYIRGSSFKGCSGLTSIEIPNSVRSIGNSAFAGCSGLTSIEIPEGVTSIGYSAFAGCSGLTSIEIPDSVTSIGDSAFAGCSNLICMKLSTSMELPSAGTKVQLRALFTSSNGRWSAPYSLKVIISPNCTYIGNWAFDGCYFITSIEIPNSVTSIGESAFRNCDGLTSIEIPEGVTSIGDSAFYCCCSLTSIEIPKGVTSIGGSAFAGCSGLTSIEIPEGVTSIGRSAFYGCSGLTSIEIPEGVTSIGDAVFYDCSSLTSIEIPEGVTSIGRSAFEGCSGLTSIEIPEGVTSIGDSAFYGCSNLESITLPESVRSIDGYAFGSTIALKDVWYLGEESAKEEIYIGPANEQLKRYAMWHYNTCKNSNHTYSSDCDPRCNNCEWVRVIEGDISGSHQMSLNSGMTCKYCGFSQKPDKPEVQSKVTGTIALISREEMEYSRDGETWQDSHVFTGLSGGTIYIFYQRIKGSSVAQVSERSDGLEVYLKSSQNTLGSPTISSYTDTTVTLRALANGEYSKDGITWQQSNVFENLLSATEYTFYQRYAETDTHEASVASAGTTITTDKSKQTLIPNAPVVQSVTASSITLIPVDGCEYSMDGTTWQSSNVFSNLSCGTAYTFYQRYKETSSTYEGKSSNGTIGKTDKGTQTVPYKPSLFKKTHNAVTLVEISGYEYSMDGVNWQTNNVFKDLNPETNYLFYQRKAENDQYYASGASTSLTVKTDEEPTYIVGDLDGDEELTDWDGVMLARYLAGWQVEINALEALDIDGDGELTDWDGVLLDRYLAGWNIQIGGQQ